MSRKPHSEKGRRSGPLAREEPETSASPTESAKRRVRAACQLTIAVAALTVYLGVVSNPFVFDDHKAIEDNPTIRHLWPIATPLSPPHGLGITVEGRPILNLSFAINYALGGTRVVGFHLMNIAIHALNGLLLFGILHRTLKKPALGARFEAGTSADLVALAVAVLWVVHPLQTESVAYIAQRAESEAGLFYLLALYSFIRGTESPQQTRWLAVSVVSCSFGMASKEVMVSLPLILFLYDRTFVAGSFHEAWRRRSAWYLGFAATWIILIGLLLGSATRGGTAGFAIGTSWWTYALTQCRSIAHYLGLSIWPHPLVLDYGKDLVRTPLAVLPQGLLVLALLGATVVALYARPVVGFLGAWFFAILAPTSSIVPLVDVMVEHRMYLPLAAVLTAIVAGFYVLGGKRVLYGCAVVALPFSLLTIRRNHDYRTELALWRTTSAERPDNARPHLNLAVALLRDHKVTEAESELETALKLEPTYAPAHDQLGVLLAQRGDLANAEAHFREAYRLDPSRSSAPANLALIAEQRGRTDEAAGWLQKAVAATPKDPALHYGLSRALSSLRRVEAAEAELRTVLDLDPKSAPAHDDLGVLLAQRGNLPEAQQHFQAAYVIDPNRASTLANLGGVAFAAGKLEEAAGWYRRAVAAKPDFLPARLNLATALERLGRRDEALQEVRTVLQLDPTNAAAAEMASRLR